LRYIAKAEIWKSKVVGRILSLLGVFPVNRSGADREALERCRAVLAGGEPLVMFPEGTRRSGPVVTDLREGVAYLAVRAGVPVVPIGIGGTERVMPRGASIPRPHRVEVVIGKPLWPPGDTAAGQERKAGRVSRRATKEFSDEIGAAIQQVFDEAQRRAGVKTA
jgi:1-acyl-sn-glycerol-3-phosphate acyltransferase